MTTMLVDHLRSLPDETLAALLRMRPDLVVPVPSDLNALALRAQSRMSIARVLDGFDRFTLEILDAARLSRGSDDGTTSIEAIFNLASGVDRQLTRAAIDRLRARFVLYGPENALAIATGVDEVSSPYPVGLGRPAALLDASAAELVADPARLRRTVLAAPPQARAVLDRLAAGPPVGTLAGGGDAGSPVRWLVDNALLVAVPTGGFELPREVGLLLRRETGPLGTLHPAPPALGAAAREPKAADSAGAGQAMDAVRHTEALLLALEAEPATVLRSGGLGVRELRRLARSAGVDDGIAATLLEAAYAAGLVGEAEAHAAPVGRPAPETQVLPTARFDAWRASSIARRWTDLATAWLTMTRQPGLVGQRDERDRPITVLAPEVERSGAPATRRTVLGILAGQPPGTAPTADELLARLDWEAPRRTRGREGAYREVLTEAALLGVTGLGALTAPGRALLADDAAELGHDERAAADPLGMRAEGDRAPDDPPSAIKVLDALLPAPVDHFLLQADLSVVVPGPPEPELAAELEVVAEPESAGGASVYRVTPEAVRHALDTGFAADDLHALFRRRSRTPVPQALTYMIDDVARRHGGLRVGGAGSYLRSDDEALVAEVLADRRLATLGLRKLAPTVLVTPMPSNRLLQELREAGYAPVPEDATGATVRSRAKVRRAPARGTGLARLGAAGAVDAIAGVQLTPPRLLGIVESIRRGDAAARTARRAPAAVRRTGNGSGPVAVQTHTQALAVLQQAIRDKALVWVGYVDAHGATMSRLVRPVSIGAGYLRAEDERTEMLHTFALHRISAAVLD
ncbi:helicase-associated domain-containing protein [Asanoa sp. WMMD1127]|uniref:helicase-associated domain-containing protein n=1 Tax=Asanoa sp. WMMD1127 TaxID=3016107 RepID=UPI0024163C89|nr:helicase-associated domain-containing protein [Asanoa sp. WMMD1127]MDG4821525.1 helicase-associated domain-containing protein [Asanoa sp. WMMD1127]